MSAVLSQKKFNVFEAVTAKIVAMIEAGLDGRRYKAPWHAPAAATPFPVNAATHAPYRGINIVSLWVDAQARGFGSPYWASYRQWQSVGAQVRKGERGSMVVFYKRSKTRPCDEEDHDRARKLHFVARASTVFNASQVDGFVADEPERLTSFQRVQEAEAFVAAVGAVVEHGRAVACYRNRDDVIEMPNREWFLPSKGGTAEESYYAVLLHELTHWSGAQQRLNRTFGRRYGDSAYAMEELVAELGAAFLCAALGINNEPREDHAMYVASWLKVLNSDPKAIFTAASKAHEAYEELAYLATRPDEQEVQARYARRSA